MAVFTNDVIIDSGTVTVDTVTNPVTVTGTVTTTPSGTQNVAVVSTSVTQPVSGTVAVSSVSGTVNVLAAVASSSTVVQVVLPATTNTTLLASNANRKRAVLFIPKSGVNVKLGAVASATSFTYQTGAANTTIEISGWTGTVDAFGPATTINVTELV